MDKTVAFKVMFFLCLDKFGFTKGQDGVTFTVSPQPAILNNEVYLTCIVDDYDSKVNVEITFTSAGSGKSVFIFDEDNLDPADIRSAGYYNISIKKQSNDRTIFILTINEVQVNDIGVYKCYVRRQGSSPVWKGTNMTLCEQVSPPSCFLPSLSGISSCSTASARGMPVCTASKGEIKNFICVPGIGFDSALNTLEWVEQGMNGNEALLSSYTLTNSTTLNYTLMNNVTLKCKTNIHDCGGYTLSCTIGIIVSSDPMKMSPTDEVTRITTTLVPLTSSIPMSTVTITAEDQQQFQVPLVMVVGIGGGALGLSIIFALIICLLRLKPVQSKYGKQDNFIMAFVPDASSKDTDMPFAIPSYENCPTNDEISQAETNIAVDIADESEPFYENKQVTPEGDMYSTGKECHRNIESLPIYDPVNIENGTSNKQLHPSGEQPVYAAVDKTNRTKQSMNDSVPDTLLENESSPSSLPVYALVQKDQKGAYKPQQEEQLIDSPMPSYAQVDKNKTNKNYSAESEYATPADLDVKRAINYAKDDLANSTSAANTKVQPSDTALYSSVQ